MHTEAINLRLAGRGGQGVMLAAFLLAQAATYEELHVVQTQSYGPEARLGAAKSDVILSPHEIAFPEILTPDILLCLSRDAFQAYGESRGEETQLLLDRQAARELGLEQGLVLPLTHTARELKAPFAANIVALGAIVELSEAVSPPAVREAIRTRVPADSFALNSRAFDAGLRLAHEVRADSPLPSRASPTTVSS
jgi:2-oxoglutarate ferredoxin oxidoreductase subunit gamma